MADNEFSVATFNLFQYANPDFYFYKKDDKENRNDKEKHWDRKHLFLRQLLTDMNADIVGFQEVFSVDDLERFMMSVGYPYFKSLPDEVGYDKNDKSIFNEPVVAIASKFPFATTPTALPANPKIIPKDVLNPSAKFERSVIEAEVLVPGLEKPLLIYVAHFKSQGAFVADDVVEAQPNWEERYFTFMSERAVNMAHQMIQRTAEATMLRQHVAARIRQDTQRGVVVMGDLNEAPSGIMYDILTQQDPVPDWAGLSPSKDENKQDVAKNAFKFRLYDTRTLRPASEGAYPPTKAASSSHAASTLDYILVSNSLNGSNKGKIARPVDVRVFDHHFNFTKDFRLNSDHAAVFTRFAIEPAVKPV